MKVEKAAQMFALMKQFGVSYFKEDGVEIKFAESEVKAAATTPAPAPQNIVNTASKGKGKKAPPLQAVPPVESNIPHHVNEVASLLKLSDNELVEKLFPDPSQEGEAVKHA